MNWFANFMRWLRGTTTTPAPPVIPASEPRLLMSDNSQRMSAGAVNGARTYFADHGHTLSWTPGGEIIYATPPGNGIRIMDSAGRNVRQIGSLSHLTGIIKPQLVGDVILFTAARAGFAGDVWVMRRDGTGLRKLTSGTAAFLSPDATWCVFTRVTPTPIHCHLWRINLDGTGEQQLTFGDDPVHPDANAPAIDFSGQTIAMFYGPEEAGQGPANWGQRDLAEMPASGGTPKVIVAATPATPGFPGNYPPLPALLTVDSPAPYRDADGQDWWIIDGGRPDGEGTYKVKLGGGPITKIASAIRGSGNVPMR